MSDYFIGEIRAFSFAFAPSGWALANGASLSVNQNQALYSLIGNAYGGNNVAFNLPDLRGRTPIHSGVSRTGSGTTYQVGNQGGSETVALAADQIPLHNHALEASTTPGIGGNPSGHYFGAVAADPDGNTPNLYGALGASPVPLSSTMLATVGGSAGHNNMQPFAVVNYCIALTGLYPMRP
ncbi:tail protein [Aliidongia dinghuensis]|uniref:Tail protein n=1 Tax=Aliidongia dinghuensis TaxID=1867774 RepID=A0A8J2YR03_9PROT|nr:tail fiber protein [Aliidongia dinghuensis]GGF06773.1 tail protein [Aliidongia dinghuensis]